MFDVTTFLMRWMFLSNILRNAAEIQTFPQQHIHHPQQPPPSTSPIQQTEKIHQSHSTRDLQQQENQWRNHCLQTILSYPPGSHRLLIADAYRIELVQRLAHSLTLSQECLRRNGCKKTTEITKTSNQEAGRHDVDLDADVEILQAIQQQQSQPQGSAAEESSRPNSINTIATSSDEGFDQTEKTTTASITPNHDTAQSATAERNLENYYNLQLPPSMTPAVARERIKQVREYLPQLVSAVLKSPQAVDPSIANPIHLLRQLLLNRCAQDPSWGIELCWQLEADVGRAWKALLEHPQQTGRRLFVILPAEKAAVLAKIGHEKSDAFELLQGAEQATAFGYNSAEPQQWSAEHGAMEHGIIPPEPRLPSSLSQRRCSHFGDTMHFVDRLTKLSLDLRRVPPSERQTQLEKSLAEMNRRIRRRMVTHGEMSLDMEDNFGTEGWPRVEDLRMDMLQHSVHFPLIPQTGTWPKGKDDNLVASQDNLEVVRVLNIVVPESRLLSSRERCPFLVQLEVADTGIEGHDARLYTAGATKVGSTIEEALSMDAMALHSGQQEQPTEQVVWSEQNGFQQGGAAYSIPQELLSSNSPPVPQTDSVLRHDFPRGGSISSNGSNDHQENNEFPRYPDQYERNYYHPNNQHSFHDPYHEQIVYQGDSPAYGFPDPYRDVRERELQDLHQHLQLRQEAWHAQQYAMHRNHEHHPTISKGKELLDNVFGVPWSERCMEIKESSPFGKVDGWRLASFIMKAGEDIRKEALVMQIISKMRSWFDDEIEPALRPIMRPYTIMSVGGDAGLVECLSDAKSVDEVKKKTDHFESLRDFFLRAYGPPGTNNSDKTGQISFEKAQDNFLRSLVGYSLVCYVLQIKDRHNANILLDRFGHVMHIDFGFVLGDTPKMGKVPIFSERAPFKLSAEFWDVLGGWNTRSGGLGVQFCKMFDKAFACASQHAEEIGAIVEMTMLGLNYDPRSARIMANGIRSRLRMRGPAGSEQQQRFIVELVSAARASWGTTTYDWLQKNMNGYQ